MKKRRLDTIVCLDLGYTVFVRNELLSRNKALEERIVPSRIYRRSFRFATARSPRRLVRSRAICNVQATTLRSGATLGRATIPTSSPFFFPSHRAPYCDPV